MGIFECEYEFPCVFMGIYGCLGVSVGDGYLWVSWVSMGVYGSLWMFMGIYECLWVSWVSVGIMGIYEPLWMFMGISECL